MADPIIFFYFLLQPIFCRWLFAVTSAWSAKSLELPLKTAVWDIWSRQRKFSSGSWYNLTSKSRDMCLECFYLFINYNTITNYFLIIYELSNFDSELGVVSQARISIINIAHYPYANSLVKYPLECQGTQIIFLIVINYTWTCWQKSDVSVHNEIGFHLCFNMPKLRFALIKQTQIPWILWFTSFSRLAFRNSGGDFAIFSTIDLENHKILWKHIKFLLIFMHYTHIITQFLFFTGMFNLSFRRII